jgi:hypothetical protein
VPPCAQTQARLAAIEAAGKAGEEKALAARLSGKQWFMAQKAGADDESAISEGSDAGDCRLPCPEAAGRCGRGRARGLSGGCSCLQPACGCAACG